MKKWLPRVLQIIQPYFTPEDIEKGTRWADEISKELEESIYGLICVTPENKSSDWVLFEAGALSKSVETSRVCPILFGIESSQLSGPLSLFQATPFNKTEIRKLLTTLNGKAGEHKLSDPALNETFELWWPQLEEKVANILSEFENADGQDEDTIRSVDDMVVEILNLVRMSSRKAPPRRRERPFVSPDAIREIADNFVAVHNAIQRGEDPEVVMRALKEIYPPLMHAFDKSMGRMSEDPSELEFHLNALEFAIASDDLDDEIPF